MLNLHCNGFFCFVVRRRRRLNGNGTTIEFTVEVLVLNKIWTTRMVCKHVSTGYSSTDVVQESMFLQKNALQREALNPAGIFRCYRLNVKAFPL